MTIAETAGIIKKIFYSYPNVFKGVDLNAVITTWHEELERCDYEKTMQVTSEHIRNSRFAPTIADICVFKERGSVPIEEMENY